MKAPHLTIAGKSINVTDIYYTVSATHPFILSLHTAGSENNVHSQCYFKNKDEAKYYQRLCELSQLISRQIKDIEYTHHNK